MISTLIFRVALWSMAGSIRGHTLAPLRKDFRMIGTTLINAPALFFSDETTQRWSDIRTMRPHVFSVFQ